MPSIGIIAVGAHREVHRRHSVLRTLARLCPFPSLAVGLPLRKPVRHKQIQHIAGIKARIFLASPIPFLQLIVKRPLFTVQDIPDPHNTRLSLRQYPKIQQLIIRTIQRHLLRQRHTGIIHREVRLGHPGPRHHHLQRVVLHPNPPIRRLNLHRLSAGILSGKSAQGSRPNRHHQTKQSPNPHNTTI